jgi:hypothetical protein
VPHRGADAAYWAKFVTDVLNITTLGVWGNSNFAAALKYNSAELASISQAFIQQAAKIPLIRTFYETVKIGNQLVSDSEPGIIFHLLM